MTYVSALVAIRDAPAWTKFTGFGYGGRWPWYRVDMLEEGTRAAGEYIQATATGPTLYHPHSTPLLFLVELGLPGAAAGVILIVVVARAVKRARHSRAAPIFAAAFPACGVVATTDLLLVKSPVLSAVWWTYLFGFLAIVGASRGRQLMARGTPSPSRRELRWTNGHGDGRQRRGTAGGYPDGDAAR
jgi:O-antigen ligase